MMNTSNRPAVNTNQPGVALSASPPAPSGYTSLLTLPPIAHRLIVSSWGQEKSGKTDWAIRTASQPVWFISLDPNGWGIAQRLAQELQIDVRGTKIHHRIPVGKGSGSPEAAKAYRDQWDAIKKAWYEAIASGVGTLVVDTGTELREESILAHLGTLEGAGRARNYGPVNADVRILFRDLFESPLSAVITHKTKDEWVNDTRTGKQLRHGWDGIEFLVQANVECRLDTTALAEWGARGKPAEGWEEVDDRTGVASWRFPFLVYVKNCATAMELSGQVYTTDERGMGFGPMVEIATGGMP